MLAAGVRRCSWPASRIDDKFVLDLAGRLRDAGLDDIAEKLENGCDRRTKILAFSIADRESILRVLDDTPDGLAELRGKLAIEHGERDM